MITLEAWKIDKMLEALEGARWLIESYVFNPAHYEEYRDVVEAIEKARGVEGEDYCPGTAEQEANASMIAAAPDMLEVLEKLSSLLVDGEEYVPLELREGLTTAIKKAEGEDMDENVRSHIGSVITLDELGIDVEVMDITGEVDAVY